MLGLQRTIGNHAVERLIHPTVSRQITPPPLPVAPFRLQRRCAQCEQAANTGGPLCPSCERQRQADRMSGENKQTLQLQRFPTITDSHLLNRDPSPKFAASASGFTAVPLALPLSTNTNKDIRPLQRSLVQRNVLTNAWNTVTEAGPAVAQAMRLAASVLVNPSQLPIVLAAIAWEQIPEALKGPIIDQILQACLMVARSMNVPSLPGLPIGTILQHAAIGFLERALSYPMGMKVRIADRMARIVLNPSMDFSIGFLKGLVVGLWDGLTGPFVLLWDLIKIGYEIQAAQMRFLSRLLHSETRAQFGQQVQAALDRIGPRIAQVVGQLMGGRNNPQAIMDLIEQLVNAALRQVESLGASLSDALLRFLNRPDRELGEGLGWLSGTITFEVLLLVLTEGGYTVLKESLQGLKVVTRLIEAGAQAWEAIGPVRAALSGFRRFAQNNRAIAPLLEAIEEVFALLIKFLRFSYGAGGPAGAAERAGEHGAAATERGAAREVRVADTAMHETHEITLLADGRLIRCSDRCIELAESIAERAAHLPAESQPLVAEAQQIASEARALKANTALSDAERAAQEQALLERAGALERQTAIAEREVLVQLTTPARRPVQSCRDLLERNPELGQFKGQLKNIEDEIEKASNVVLGKDGAQMRPLVEEELRSLERQAQELEAQMRQAAPDVPTAPVPEVPAFVRENRVPLRSETFLADAGRFTSTGKSIKGATIYRGADGRYYHIDTLHTGSTAEIEFYNATGSTHLGTMNPITGEVIGGPVKGRSLDRYL